MQHCGLLNGELVDTRAFNPLLMRISTSFGAPGFRAHLQSANFRRPVRHFWAVPICSDPSFILSEKTPLQIPLQRKYSQNMPKNQLAKFIQGMAFFETNPPPSQGSLDDLSLASLRQSQKPPHASIRERIRCFLRAQINVTSESLCYLSVWTWIQ